MTATYVFRVQGMHCASCGMLIDEALEDIPGVTCSTTSVKAGRTTVIADSRVGPTELAATIVAAGYVATHEET
ncbi:cation transporter [Longispora sp. NPDC051575]|uniref:heavy-metal-associated domain-containing protein n=1 Tax=Longispora sp. NPDC051575 TaxID=3154943 RepID=UPI00342294D2